MAYNLLSDYVKRLAATTEKKTIIKDFRFAIEELDMHVSSITGLDIEIDEDSPLSKSVLRELKNTDALKNKGLLYAINHTAETILENESDIFNMIKKELSDEQMKSAITYRIISIMRYVEAISFFNKYTLKLISTLLVDSLDRETSDEFSEKGYDALNRVFVEDHVNTKAYAKCIEILSMPVDDFLSKLEKIKGYTYNEGDYETTKASNGYLLDPYNFGFIPADWHPVVIVGRFINNWRALRNESMKEEVTRINLIIMMLNEEAAAAPDPETKAKLTKQIDNYAKMVFKLEKKINDYEGK